MSSLFTVLICHGLYHTPEFYQPLIETFASHGIEAHCPQLPSSDPSKLNVGDINAPNFDRDPPVAAYPQGDADAKVITDSLHNLITESGKRVIILAHSAGGWVGTQAAVPPFQEKVRREKALKGGIVGLFYFGAFVIPLDESIHSFFQPKDGNVVVPPWLEFHPNGLATLKDPEQFLFHDLCAEEVTKWRPKLTASPIMTTVLTNDAYATLPSAYLILEGDRIVPKVYQESMATLQGQKTGKFKIYHSPAGHAAQLSHAEELVTAVLDFEEGITALK
ncbi:Alpha/beta hydrolase fold-1 [Paraphoma chrysanthemicola]|uniref:Alpha/beta hydrolase fold-1 n=1 Tax=Paraphoma chrysanthemicola TaxID=798071 RepID=A0A8K0RDG9_9PLEO|nr:Alpha/beta hydrolase fold-1 [Paraphoma chrysanthemicola]